VVSLLKSVFKKGSIILTTAALAISLTACGGNADANQPESGAQESVTGKVIIDGSSTVYPISQAVAEEFMLANSGIQVEVSASGTGGGFKKFASGEIDITGASRPIKDSEKETANANGVEEVELKVANDGLTVVINPENDWATDMTVEELKKLWEPAAEGKITKWSQIREGWPEETINLYGAGTDSGTFDYFTEAIVGEGGASRGDYNPTEDDHITIQGVAGDKYAMGYFGYAYYVENQDKLTAISINGVAPSPETIEDGSYAPLSRPIFIYVNKASLEKPEVKKYLEYHFTEGTELIGEVGYVPLAESAYEENLSKAGLE
jgi:phosphate transport system substrate-binding protein